MVADIDGFLPDSAFLLDVPATDWKDAIRLAGKGLVAAGFTTDAYTDQMIETVEKMGRTSSSPRVSRSRTPVRPRPC